VRLSAQSGQAAGRIDGTDVGPYALQGGQCPSLSLDLANDVFPDAGAEIRRRAREPPTFLLEQVRRHALRLVGEVRLVASGLVEGADRLVYLLSSDRAADLQTVGGGELASCSLLRLDQVAEQDMSVCKCLFDDESIRGVVVEGIAKSSGLCRALGSVVVAGHLDGLAKLPVGVR